VAVAHGGAVAVAVVGGGRRAEAADGRAAARASGRGLGRGLLGLAQANAVRQLDEVEAAARRREERVLVLALIVRATQLAFREDDARSFAL
jgi:hypothetical protein